VTAPVEIPTPVESRAVPAPPVTVPVEKITPVETQALPAPPPAAPTEKSPVETKAVPAAPISAPVVSSPIESRVIPSQTPVERKDTPSPSSTTPEASTTPKTDEPSLTNPRTDSPFRAPPAGTSPFRTPRDAPSANDYDPTKPQVDVDAAKKRAAEIAKEGAGQRALFAMPIAKPKNKMEEAIEKARKPDCRTAYQNLGLLAIVPLVANEFGEGSCRW